MLFYFTGTGNSYAAAFKLKQELGGELINITDCMQNETYEFEPGADEPVGIVCPIYYGGLPSIVNDFLERVSFSTPPDYLYGVLTYGGVLYGTGRRLIKKTNGSGLKVSAVWGVKMPANYAMLYEPAHEEAAKPILEAAEKRLGYIAEQIRDRKSAKEGCGIAGSAASAIVYPMYDRARSTRPFHVNEKCVSCGICAARCPVRAIEMVDGVPTWVIDKCVFCMSCVRCNAIQYGEKLKGRYRYRNPVFQNKKKHCGKNENTSES